MACAKQCDICGSFYRSNVKQIIKGSSPIAYMDFHSSDGPGSFRIQQYDVCDDCAQKIYNLITEIKPNGKA